MQRRNMTTVRNVGIAIVLMVCLGFVYMYHGLSTKLYETENTHERCKRNIESLNSQVQDLMSTFETQRKKTENDRADLVNRAKKAESQHKMLQTQHDDIKHSYETLSQTHKKAVEDHGELETRNAQEYNLYKKESEMNIAGLKDKIANLERYKEKLMVDQEASKLQLQQSQAKLADDAVLLGTMRDQNTDLKNPKKDLEALTSTNQQPDTTTTVQTTKKDLEALTTMQTPDTTITVQVLPDTTITVQQLNAQLQNDISQHKAAEQSLHNAAEQEIQKAAEHAVHIPNVDNGRVNHMNQKPNNIPNIKDSAVDGQNVDVGDVPGVPKQMRPPVPDDQMQMGYKQHDDKNKLPAANPNGLKHGPVPLHDGDNVLHPPQNGNVAGGHGDDLHKAGVHGNDPKQQQLRPAVIDTPQQQGALPPRQHQGNIDAADHDGDNNKYEEEDYADGRQQQMDEVGGGVKHLGHGVGDNVGAGDGDGDDDREMVEADEKKPVIHEDDINLKRGMEQRHRDF